MKKIFPPTMLRSRRPRETGMALVIALIFLLMLTLLGVSALSTNTAEERMTYASADYTRALQAADSAVSQGEIWLLAQNKPPVPDDGTGTMTFPAPDTTTQMTAANLHSLSWWNSYGLDFSYTYLQDGSTPTSRSDAALAKVTTDPRYVLQYLGQGSGNSLGIGGAPPPPVPYYYRVTGMGYGQLPQMQSVTQSIFAKTF